MKAVLCICVFLTTVILRQCEAIRCFQCNSVNNSACIDLEDYGRYKDFLIPTPCPNDFGTTNPFCRKTVLKVLDKTKRIEERVIRSCGWLPYKKECYSTDNEGHQEKVCQCFEDGCNSTDGMKPIRLFSIIVAILSSMFLHRLF